MIQYCVLASISSYSADSRQMEPFTLTRRHHAACMAVALSITLPLCIAFTESLRAVYTVFAVVLIINLIWTLFVLVYAHVMVTDERVRDPPSCISYGYKWIIVKSCTV